MGSSLSCAETSNSSSFYDYYADFNETDCNCSDTAHMWIPACMFCDFEYEYDASDAGPSDLERVIPLGVIYSLVFLMGTIGNGLVIFVVRRYKRMRNVTNIFLASLSTADLLLIWFCVPIQYLKYLSHSWTMGAFFCYSVHYVQQFTRMCSVLTLTTISIERYLAIAYPMKTMWLNSIGRCKKVILVIWMVAALLAVPSALRLNFEKIETMYGRTAYWCMRGFPPNSPLPSQDLEFVYGIYQFMVMMVIPLLTMTFCYARIAKIVFSSSKSHLAGVSQIRKKSSKFDEDILEERGGGGGGGGGYVPLSPPAVMVEPPTSSPKRSMASDRGSYGRNASVSSIGTLPRASNASMISGFGADNPPHTARASLASTFTSALAQSPKRHKQSGKRVSENSRKQIVQMLLAIVILYTICWGPTLVDDLLIGFGVFCLNTMEAASPQTLMFMRMAFAIMAYANSCVNPMVYGFISKNFRNTFKATCCKCWRDRKRSLNTTRDMRSSQPDLGNSIQRAPTPQGRHKLMVQRHGHRDRSVSFNSENSGMSQSTMMFLPDPESSFVGTGRDLPTRLSIRTSVRV